jgi:hypothetical protein
MGHLSVDAVLGGVEHVRNQLQDLMLAVEVSFPDVYEKLDEIDTELLDLSDALEEHEEAQDFDEDYTFEDFNDLITAGVITPADVDDFAEAWGGE